MKDCHNWGHCDWRIRWYIDRPSKVSDGNLVATDKGQESPHVWTCGEFSTAQLLVCLYARLTVGEYTSPMFGLDDI